METQTSKRDDKNADSTSLCTEPARLDNGSRAYTARPLHHQYYHPGNLHPSQHLHKARTKRSRHAVPETAALPRDERWLLVRLRVRRGAQCVMWTAHLSSERGTNGENGLRNQFNSNDSVGLSSKRADLERSPSHGAQNAIGAIAGAAPHGKSIDAQPPKPPNADPPIPFPISAPRNPYRPTPTDMPGTSTVILHLAWSLNERWLGCWTSDRLSDEERFFESRESHRHSLKYRPARLLYHTKYE